MMPRDFCYWLQGFFEINSAGYSDKTDVSAGITDARAKVIQRRLAMVEIHEIDSSCGDEKHNHVVFDNLHDKPHEGGIVLC